MVSFKIQIIIFLSVVIPIGIWVAIVEEKQKKDEANAAAQARTVTHNYRHPSPPYPHPAYAQPQSQLQSPLQQPIDPNTLSQRLLDLQSPKPVAFPNARLIRSSTIISESARSVEQLPVYTEFDPRTEAYRLRGWESNTLNMDTTPTPRYTERAGRLP